MKKRLVVACQTGLGCIEEKIFPWFGLICASKAVTTITFKPCSSSSLATESFFYHMRLQAPLQRSKAQSSTQNAAP